MCGIAGKLSFRDAVDPELVERMCRVIEHRGPDSRGTFVEGGVGLGVQRLAIIDLETGDQPISNEDGSVVVVQNGEIYNYRELREELAARGHTLSTRTDTEVIVHLYEEHGDDCVRFLRGMFAFALWDKRRRRLLLARDRVGKKPLFYSVRDDTIWFGSETKSILEDPAVPRDVDYEAIDSFLHFQYVPQPRSAFAALRKLPPAHTLAWDEGGVPEVKRYWRLSYSPDDSYASEEEMHERVREELLEATRIRLRSDVPLGAFLSGGIDSSAVVAAMARLSEGDVKTFSIGFDVEEYDETKYAREVAELYGTDHHEFRVEPHAIDVLPQLVWHYGEPFADQSAIPSFYLSELTRRHVTVALNGDGGDESFAGYQRYRTNVLARRLGALRPLALVGDRVMQRVGPGPNSRSARARAHRVAYALSLDAPKRYSEWVAYFRERDREDLYTPEFRAALGTVPLASDRIRDLYLASDATAFSDRLLDVDVNSYLPDDLLVKMDIATMAHSLEVRSPFLDHRMMEMAARLPASAKLHGADKKHVLKRALRPWLPDRILYREKMGFGVPLAAWFRGALSELPAQVLLDPRALERGMFREDAVRRLIDRHRSGAEDTSNRLWALLQLELWLRTYVDSSTPAPLAMSV